MTNPFATASVPQTEEVARIAALPRRKWESLYSARDIELMSEAFRRPESNVTLRMVQLAALEEISRLNGGFFPMGVGSGKTLVSFFAAKAVGAKRPLLLVPAKLRDKTLAEYKALQQHWLLPALTVQSYELLSRAQHAKMLDMLAPDLIVCDEGQKLKNPKAAVTRRVARYLRERKHKRPSFVILSGTITRKSLLEYWHLLKWALGENNSPLPKSWEEVVCWSSALDGTTSGFRAAPGALTQFVPSDVLPTLDGVRKGFQSRLTETPGVLATSVSSCDSSLTITPVHLKLGTTTKRAIQEMRATWETPDEHPFSEAVELWRHARELACGFFYRWNPRPPRDWLENRKQWCRFVRETLKNSRKLDSELQVTVAVKNGEIPGSMDFWQPWANVRDTFKPETEAVWLSKEALDYASNWLSSNTGIVWVESTAFGERLALVSGKPYYGQGGKNSAGKAIESETGSCIASIAANAEGRNLQRYSANLVVSGPPSGALWEQLLGRTHRPGQESEEVTFEVLFSCAEQWAGFEKALGDAKYIEGTLGTPQKLNFADILGFDKSELV